MPSLPISLPIMKRVIVESRFANGDLQKNIRYFRLCFRDCILNHQEAPFSSQAYSVPYILERSLPGEKIYIVEASLAWISVAEKAVFYTDLGIDLEMEKAQARYESYNLLIEWRALPSDLLEFFRSGKRFRELLNPSLPQSY